MRKGKLTQAALSRSVLRVLEKRREDVVISPAYGCSCGIFHGCAGTEDENESESGQLTVTACGSSAGFPTEAPECAVREACGHLLAAGAEPVGITVNLLLPETFEESRLKTLIRRLDNEAGAYGAAILGGHTEVSGQVLCPVVSVTAVGKAKELPLLPDPEMDLVAVGTIAATAAGMLAREQREHLKGHFSEGFLCDAAEMAGTRVLPAAVKVLKEKGRYPMKAVFRGGIFAALWEMAEHAGIGLDVELKRIPIRQETIELCEYFSLNPYQLFCTDMLLVAATDGAQLVRELARHQIPAMVIGRTTAGKERVLRNGEEVRYLDKPQTDEWYRMEEQAEHFAG